MNFFLVPISTANKNQLEYFHKKHISANRRRSQNQNIATFPHKFVHYIHEPFIVRSVYISHSFINLIKFCARNYGANEPKSMHINIQRCVVNWSWFDCDTLTIGRSEWWKSWITHGNSNNESWATAGGRSLNPIAVTHITHCWYIITQIDHLWLTNTIDTSYERFANPFFCFTANHHYATDPVNSNVNSIAARSIVHRPPIECAWSFFKWSAIGDWMCRSRALARARSEFGCDTTTFFTFLDCFFFQFPWNSLWGKMMSVAQILVPAYRNSIPCD